MIKVEFKDDVACGIMKHIFNVEKDIKIDLKDLNAEIVVNYYELGEETKEENKDLIEEFTLLGLEPGLKWHIHIKELDEDFVRVTIKYYDGEIITDSIVKTNAMADDLDIYVLEAEEDNGAKSAIGRALIFSLTVLSYLDSEAVHKVKEENEKYIYESVPLGLLRNK